LSKSRWVGQTPIRVSQFQGNVTGSPAAVFTLRN
jgi:hypothetical protein